MRWIVNYPLSVIREAATTVLGWTIVIAITVFVAFIIGYWLGHGEIKPLGTTLGAMAWLPVVWLGRPLVIGAYVVTGLAWYLPLRYESKWLRLAAVLVSLLMWIVIIAVEVERCSHNKFWSW